MARPSFASVKRNYRKSISSIYQNTCAIRISLALAEADTASVFSIIPALVAASVTASFAAVVAASIAVF